MIHSSLSLDMEVESWILDIFLFEGGFHTVMGCHNLVRLLFATPFYGPAFNAISHGYILSAMGRPCM